MGIIQSESDSRRLSNCKIFGSKNISCVSKNNQIMYLLYDSLNKRQPFSFVLLYYT